MTAISIGALLQISSTFIFDVFKARAVIFFWSTLQNRFFLVFNCMAEAQWFGFINSISARVLVQLLESSGN
jgi:Na+/serine symporter